MARFSPRISALAVLGLGAFLTALPAAALDLSEKVGERLERAAEVIDEILAAPDKGIPQDLLDRAACVVVIPGMKKGGLGIGGRYGRGTVACRLDRGRGAWGPPSMVYLSGGSIGLQIGGTAVDVVMLVMNEEGIRNLLRSKFTVGGDGSAVAGPVGRAGTAETDALMHAKILTWSRARGIFAGLELKGAVLGTDDTANRALYGERVKPERLLLEGEMAVPAAGRVFIRTLDRHSPHHVSKGQ